MDTAQTLLLLSLATTFGCSNLDRGGISSGGDQPAPAPGQTTSGSTQSASGPAATPTSTPNSTVSTTVGNDTPAPAAATSAPSQTAQNPAVASSFAGGLMAGTGAVPAVFSAGGSSTAAGTIPVTLHCEAQIAVGKTCQITSDGVSIAGGSMAATLFTAALPDLAAVLNTVQANSTSVSSTIINPGAPWCAVQVLGVTYLQVDGINGNAGVPNWMANLMAFLRLNCLSSAGN